MRKLKMKYVLYLNFYRLNDMNKHDARRAAKQVVKFTHISERMKKRLGVDQLSDEDIKRCRIMVFKKKAW